MRPIRPSGGSPAFSVINVRETTPGPIGLSSDAEKSQISDEHRGGPRGEPTGPGPRPEFVAAPPDSVL